MALTKQALMFALTTALFVLPALPSAAAQNVSAQACSVPVAVCSTATLTLNQFFCYTRPSDGDRECDAQWTLTVSTGSTPASLSCARAWAPAYYENYDWGIYQFCGGAGSVSFWSYHRPNWFGTTEWSLDARVCSSTNGILEQCANTASITIYFY